METSTLTTTEVEDPLTPQIKAHTQEPTELGLEKQASKKPMVTIEYQGLEGEGKWRLEHVFRLWCEWYDDNCQKLQVDQQYKSSVDGLSSGKMGYGYSVGAFVAEEQTPRVEDCMKSGESLSFNLEYEQRYERVPQYDRAREMIPLQQAAQDAPPQHHVSPRCFNCGSYNHGVRDCKREYSLSNINRNKASYAGPIGSSRGSGRGRGDRSEGRQSGHRQSRDMSGMKRFLPRNYEIPEDNETTPMNVGRQRRDKIPRNDQNSWDQDRRFRPAEKNEFYPDDLAPRPRRGNDKGSSKKPKIDEVPIISVPPENITISLEESTEEGELSAEDGDETDSIDDVIIITRGGQPDKCEPVSFEACSTGDVIPGLGSPVRKVMDVSFKLKNGETESVPGLDFEPLEDESKGERNASLLEDSSSPRAPEVEHKIKEDRIANGEPTAGCFQNSAQAVVCRTQANSGEDAEENAALDEPDCAWNGNDKEEGELDVEEGEIVEKEAEPGMFTPTATRQRSHSPEERKRIGRKSNGPSLPGSTAQGSYLYQGRPSRFVRQNQPPARRLPHGTMQSGQPNSITTSNSATHVAAAAAAYGVGQAPFHHRPSQNLGPQKPPVARTAQPHFPQVGGIANRTSSALHGAHQHSAMPGIYESRVGKNVGSCIVPGLQTNGAYFYGPNPQNNIPVSSSKSTDPHHMANINQFRNSPFVAQKVVMQRGLVGQQRPLISRNPQIVGTPPLQGSALQHPFQAAQQPYVHFHSQANMQPGTISWQQEHHNQSGEGFAGQRTHMPNSQIHYQTHPQQQQQQQPHQNFVHQQQFVQMGSNMVVLNSHGQQMVVKHTSR